MRQGEEVKLLALIDSERPTAWRSLLANVDRVQRRSKHIADVLSEIVRSNGRSRVPIDSRCDSKENWTVRSFGAGILRHEDRVLAPAAVRVSRTLCRPNHADRERRAGTP